jgi:PAS domain S-box-containing protein
MDRVIQSWNAAAERIFEFTAAEVVGQPVTAIVPAGMREEAARTSQRLRNGERIDQFETVRLTKSGKEVPVSLTISPLTNADGGMVGVASIYRDISEQKRTREALAGVNRKLIEAQEEERSRIARELHDDIAQRLALLAFDVEDIMKGSRNLPPLHHKAVTLRDNVSEIAMDVQGLSHELHSPRLELLGITAAFKDFCEHAAHQQKTTITFQPSDVPGGVPSGTSLCLFRVVQEAVHNAAKHSGVRSVQVRLWGTPGHLHLVVSDQGAGFDVEATRAGRGIGLISMAERIKLVDGELSIESRPLQGTTIRVRVPLPGDAGA